MYYDRKMGNRGSTQQMLSSPMKHDYSYWTGTTDPTSYQLNKLSRHQNDDQVCGTSGEMIQPQNYQSYRKKMQYQQAVANAHSPSHQNVRPNFGSNTEFNGRNGDNRNSWLATNSRHGRQQMNPTENMPQQNYHTYGDEEPVYEEILSRTNENCDGSDLTEYPHSPTRDSDNLLKNMRIAQTNSSHKMDAQSAQQQQPLHSR